MVCSHVSDTFLYALHILQITTSLFVNFPWFSQNAPHIMSNIACSCDLCLWACYILNYCYILIWSHKTLFMCYSCEKSDFCTQNLGGFWCQIWCAAHAFSVVKLLIVKVMKLSIKCIPSFLLKNRLGLPLTFFILLNWSTIYGNSINLKNIF